MEENHVLNTELEDEEPDDDMDLDGEMLCSSNNN